MIKYFLWTGSLLVFLASCNSGTESESVSAAPRMPKQYAIEQLYSNLAVGAAGFNADETKVLVHNNSTGIFNVYELNVADTMMQPLTASKKESFFAVDYLPG